MSTERDPVLVIRKFVLGEFIEAIIKELDRTGYTLQPHDVLKIGPEYIATLRAVPKGFGGEPITTKQAPKPEAQTELAGENELPDYGLIARYIRNGEKEELKQLALRFGVNLNKSHKITKMRDQFYEELGVKDKT